MELASFIRTHKQELMREWLSRVRALPAATVLPTPLLADHVPEILDALADALERGDATSTALEQMPLEHAAQRYREGYDLRQIVAEYRMLRQIVVEAYQRHGEPRMAPIATMNELVDRAIGDAVDHYAVEHDRARDFFVGILGHDLRNPLNTLSLTSAVLLQLSAQGGAMVEARLLSLHAERVASSVNSMRRMIADLLDFARGRLGGGFPVTPIPSDLRAVVKAAVHELAVAHPTRDIRCLVDQAPGDFSGIWDPDRVAQAVSNLVGNAIQHGQDPIFIELRDEGEKLLLAIRSRGLIPPEHRQVLFNPFKGSTGTGTGLGLYIVREIARAHGGTVELEDSPAGETLFIVTLPRNPPGPPMPAVLAVGDADDIATDDGCGSSSPNSSHR